MDLSLDKRLLKIFRDLNDNVAPTDSPHFTGIPRVPSPNGENVKQISNTEYATRKINELYDLILASVTTFENRLNKYNLKLTLIKKVSSFDYYEITTKNIYGGSVKTSNNSKGMKIKFNLSSENGSEE